MLRTLTTPEALDAQVFVTQDVFRIMAGIDVDSAVEPSTTSAFAIESLLHYTGGASGRMLLDCSAEVAKAFAIRVTGLPAEALSGEDIKDAVGELVNMIGGNLKALLPADTHISTPQVFPASENMPWIDEASMISSLDFDCEFGRFRLRVYR